MNSTLLYPWVAELVLITYRDVQGKTQSGGLGFRHLPLPSEFLATFVVFGALGLLAGEEGEGRTTVATMFGWGVVVATLLNLWNPTTAPSIVQGGTKP